MLALSAAVALVINSGRVLYRMVKAFCDAVNPIAYGIIFGLITALIVLIFALSRVPDIFLPRFLLELSHYGLGVLLYFVLIMNLVSLFLYIGKLIRLVPSPQPVALSVSAFLICSALAVGFTAYGIINAKSIDTVCYSIKTESENVKGFKIALISDLHIGYIVDAEYLEKVALEVNEMDADIVCISGDVFDGDITAISDRDAIKNAFLSIKSKYGVYACLGNHDAGESYGEMLGLLRESGVQLLLDEYTVIDNRLLLVGRRDSSPIGNHESERTDVFLPEDNRLPVVVLDHKPGNITEYGNDVDLILCGHTHLGQMFPFNLVVRAMYDAPYGYYRASADSPEVITTSGAGTWGPPFRIGSNNEAVKIILE